MFHVELNTLILDEHRKLWIIFIYFHLQNFRIFDVNQGCLWINFRFKTVKLLKIDRIPHLISIILCNYVDKNSANRTH